MDLKKSIDNHLKIVEKKFSLGKIKGIDIINITESKQLNLLIIKSLYDQWILNFEKNKLKYFNYEAAGSLSPITLAKALFLSSIVM